MRFDGESVRPSVPDVSVVVAVYDTMPYLTACLTSLVEQTIGRDRLQVVAVDDGSTDGSGEELDRFAARYPETFVVLHQANSGGPAAPSNRALERATGRYVFFVGSDDHLGPEALERLVTAADRWESDVVLGRMVGTNKRYVHQAVYARSEPDLDLFDSDLPWSLSNTKLFRRDLVERHRLRFREDMPMGSDQPFTLEACYRARRISVLADYDYYYAVRRENAQNITYRSRHEQRLCCAEKIVDFVAGLIEPGERRDAVLVRHFTWEVAKLLRKDFLDLSEDVQQQVHTGVRKLAEQYLTDGVRSRLPADVRLRLAVAQQGDLTHLRDLVRQEADRDLPPVTVEDGRWYAAYVGFRDPRLSLPDDLYDVTHRAGEIMSRLTATGLTWRRHAGRRVLTLTAHPSWTGPGTPTYGPLRVGVGESTVDAVVSAGGHGTVVRADLPADELVRAVGSGHRLVGARAEASGSAPVPVRAERRLPASRAIVRQGVRFYLVTPTVNHKGQVIVAVTAVTPRRFIARLRRIWSSGGK
ncbi:glycosyltransferase [Micromonospora sp. C31]|uniref:glycosyltransferase family 2 protein n=1 Tax=Micromonospora sp. C31 TaxID=2824876 RepID=UPI001B35A83A|nr:glycosyltransferase [Micromonospora sp. C31]MBQ1075086.1 glycosyltransferase [Micromonospora sp. C31]